MIYFTADTHFHHANIIKYCHRPFANVPEMNAALLANWNKTVQPEDEVYILGDFALNGEPSPAELLAQLNGTKYLIRGNHDEFAENLAHLLEQNLLQWVKDYYELTYQGQLFILSHYPFAEWNGQKEGSICLHGHQHNPMDYNLRQKALGFRRYDVGADANHCTPVSLDSIRHFFNL